MRKVYLLAAAALLAPTVALADGEPAMGATPYFGGVFVGMTTMEMPEHANGGIEVGTPLAPLVAQADVDGWTVGFGGGKMLASGWRVGLYGRYFDGEGASSTSYTLPNAAASTIGRLNGTSISSGPLAGAQPTTQRLDVNVTEWSGTLAVGHKIFDLIQGDILVIYTGNETDNSNLVTRTFVGGSMTHLLVTNFKSNGVELAGRLGIDVDVGDGISFGIGGSGGYAYRQTDMNARQRQVNSTPAVVDTSTIAAADDDSGFVGRADANLSFALTDRLAIAAVGSYVSDSLVPVFVAQDYTAGTPASFTVERQATTSYGLRLVTRW
jgi:hypothetical protein